MFGVRAFVCRTYALLCCLLICGALGRAQCNAPEPDFHRLPQVPVEKPSLEQTILPEAGFLTNTHYTSQFFGFSFDLPLTVKGHEYMIPVMSEKEHALLALQFEEGQRKGYMMITAYDPLPEFKIKTPEEKEKELRRWGQEGTQAGGLPQIIVPQFMLHYSHFYHQFRRRGRNYAAQYWTGINDYMVKIIFVTNDEDFMQKAKLAMENVRLYCPKEDGTLTTEDGKPVKVEGEPYYGPTVPTFRVNTALRDQPAKNIPAGEVVEGVYRNPEIGFDYTPPAGWSALMPAKSDPPLEATAPREFQFLHACSQTLLQMTPAGPEHNGNGDLVVVLRALDPNCLSMRTAASLRDKRAADEVAATFEQLGEFGEIDSDQLLSISGHLFMIFHGTIATGPRSEQLGKRLSQTIFATRYNKLLLVWSFMAPNAAALNQLPTGSIAFQGSSPIQLAISKYNQP